ncbi:hypothetical protein ILYODFUR_027488 [Ilyodon furcidens]|uniref:Uncharacterized protein n=1 Tax=Ilyodon furcidens TaxID=33524 RepID=A0ABV0TBJ3_9TELE
MTVLSSPSPSPPCTPIPESSFCQRPSPAQVSPTQTPPSGPKPDIDSATFWRNCNIAGCTQAIFAEFIIEINNISSRIQCDQASQEGKEEKTNTAHKYELIFLLNTTKVTLGKNIFCF